MATNLTSLTNVRGLSSILRDRERQLFPNLARDARLLVTSADIPEATPISLRASVQPRIEGAIQTQLLTQAFTASSTSRRTQDFSLLTGATASLQRPPGTNIEPRLQQPSKEELIVIESAAELERFLEAINDANEGISAEFKTLDDLMVELQLQIDNIDLNDFKDAPLNSTLQLVDGVILNLERLLPPDGISDELIVELQNQLDTFAEFGGHQLESVSTEEGNIIDTLIAELSSIDPEDPAFQSRLTDPSVKARNDLAIRLGLVNRLVLELRRLPMSGTDLLRKEPVVSTQLNISNTINDDAIIRFNENLSARLELIAGQIGVLNAIPLPQEPEPTLTTTEPRLSGAIRTSSRTQRNLPIGVRVRSNPDASTADFSTPRNVITPFQLGTGRLASPIAGQLIIERQPLAASGDFTIFAASNTDLLANNLA